ncbi:TAXI family TRAP transporter solute-binding subunit [Sphingobium xenophagum]|uniref:TAXI family TRAP transporter solute-binding subunit n=1 Tax=Sphingobium xenophagum TaxID=121428 RepID=UPI00030A1729|nr:TAXI family TRAP transporter solute-binding subunit [Sphingobium xenophagum]
MKEDIGPRIDFRVIADWGNANFHTIAGWLLANLRWQSAPRSQFWIKTGTGYADNIAALVSGEVDLAITTPYDFGTRWAMEGKHFYEGPPAPFLRTLGCLPQFDKLIFAIRADTGITSFAELRERKFPLKLATSTRTPENLMTWVVERVLALHGIEIEPWGGEWLGHDHPRFCIPQAIDGTANAVMYEAIMVPQWRELVEKVPMNFLPFEDHVLKTLQSDYGIQPSVLPKGRLTDEDIACVDFSNWAVLVRDDLDEDTAYRITRIMVEKRGEFEGRFQHLPSEKSPLTYPIDPYTMWKGIGVPLHPGAERYYREHGYMD